MLRTAAALLPLALVAGCASGGSATPEATAQDRLADARAQAAALSSFAFRSVTELPGKTALQRTVIDGRAAVPDRVAYTVTIGGTKADVVRIADKGYSRTLPNGRWAPETGTAKAAVPAVVLQRVLAAADDPVDKGDVVFDGRTGRMVEVTLTAEEVRTTGLLDAQGGSDVPVTLALDPQGRVLRLAVELPLQAGATQGVLRQVTTYGSFGTAPEITAPV
ncbi:MAG: hypothetical protein Q8R60_16725 [Mycobacteriales bacterium]|nr:hypothetical protein [Mycobacteriales bacterium]